MKRRLGLLASFFSLLLCAGVVALWSSSYHFAQTLYLGAATNEVTEPGQWLATHRLHSAPGRLQWISDRSQARDPGIFILTGHPGHDTHPLGGKPAEAHSVAGFEWVVFRGYSMLSIYRPFGPQPAPLPVLARRLSIPYWFLVLASGAGAVPWLCYWVRRRRVLHWRRQGRCSQCGYDMRATPQRCPECGTPV
jgi:hypothetical protein